MLHRTMLGLEGFRSLRTELYDLMMKVLLLAMALSCYAVRSASALVATAHSACR